MDLGTPGGLYIVMEAWTFVDWLAAVAAAVAAGLMGATTGGGGGLVVLPALYLLGLTPAEGLANTRLLFFVGALASVVAYARAGRVRWRRIPPLIVSAVLGALVGAWAVPGLPSRLPKILLAAMAVGLVLLKGKPAREGAVRVTAPGLETGLLVSTGFAVGLVASMVGGGAGMALAALLIGLGWPALEAVAAAQTTVAASNFAAFASYAALGKVDAVLSIALAVAALAAAFAGARWLSGLPADKADRVVRATLVVVALVTLADAILG